MMKDVHYRILNNRQALKYVEDAKEILDMLSQLSQKEP